jgi:predicted RNase H-like HicB family nuclease
MRGDESVKRIIQVRITQGEKYYVAECLDLPVVTQGQTLDELKANIEEAISLHLEGEDLSEYEIAPEPYVLASFELDLTTHA